MGGKLILLIPAIEGCLFLLLTVVAIIKPTRLNDFNIIL